MKKYIHWNGLRPSLVEPSGVFCCSKNPIFKDFMVVFIKCLQNEEIYSLEWTSSIFG